MQGLERWGPFSPTLLEFTYQFPTNRQSRIHMQADRDQSFGKKWDVRVVPNERQHAFETPLEPIRDDNCGLRWCFISENVWRESEETSGSIVVWRLNLYLCPLFSRAISRRNPVRHHYSDIYCVSLFRKRSLRDIVASFMLIYSHFNETPVKWHYALSCLIFVFICTEM